MNFLHVGPVIEMRDGSIKGYKLSRLGIVSVGRMESDFALTRLIISLLKERIESFQPIAIDNHVIVEKGDVVAVS